MNIVTIDLDQLQKKIKVAIENGEYLKKKGDTKGASHWYGRFLAYCEMKEMTLNTPNSVTPNP